MAQGVLVVVEQRNGAIRKVSWEVLSEGKRLADQLGQEMAAVLMGGEGISALAEDLGQWGASRVFVAEHGELAQYRTNPYTRVVVDVARQMEPQIILMGASSTGKDLAPRVAARLGVGLLSDCVGFELQNGTLVGRRPMYAGKLYAYVACKAVPQIATARPNVFPKAEPNPAGKAQVLKVSPQFDELDTGCKVLELREEASGRPDLTEAEIIVSGGRGMKGPENYQMLETLADLLGGTVGASRAAVDAGWRPQSDQVGQTGKVVTPNLYIACGISGSIQHLAGMGTSKVIVAINKDPDAPIFQKADYGVVDDLFKVVPPLIEEVRKLKAE
ncbi:MAG: electron transfer flavoprotein subunit alpha/FixB family protein [Thermodesulfobacteriota bacterium]